MANLQAVINPPIQEVRLGSSATFSCYVYDNAGHESTQPMSYAWEAAPYIVQEQRYNFSEDKHVLEIYNIQVSDNNTAVWCQVDPSSNGNPSNKAQARIVVLPVLPGNAGMPSPSRQPTTTTELFSSPERQRSSAAGATVAGLLVVLIVFALLLIFGYRKMKNNRSKNLWIGSKLLGGKQGPRKSQTRYTGGEDGYQDPIIPTVSNPPQYTSLVTNVTTTPVGKRPIPPPRNKKGARRNTEPTVICSIPEVDSYNITRSSSADPPRGINDQTGYVDMSGKNGKRQNRTPRRAFSQYEQDEDTDYENIVIKTTGKRGATGGANIYVNQNVADKNRGHLPSHMSNNSSSSSSSKPNGGAGTLVYASLDLEDSSEVFEAPEVERTTYAKILRILSVLRTMRSTRIRVMHTGLDGEHPNGECQTTRYR